MPQITISKTIVSVHRVDDPIKAIEKIAERFQGKVSWHSLMSGARKDFPLKSAFEFSLLVTDKEIIAGFYPIKVSIYAGVVEFHLEKNDMTYFKHLFNTIQE